ncbi:HK97 family phage prohead protease [Phaeospirillum tilakii]|uniref:HK97 family phage prohead protease n=1 Tax=Phaeospirillum tilakii TaxID=741673 RepID=A0ABW5CF26_9PROT
MDRASFGLREVKLAGGDAMTFSGYGAVFDNVDSCGDVIIKGAFTETLDRAKSSGQWPAMLMQHGGLGLGADDMTPVGIWTDLEEDNIGLKVTGKLADTTRGREAYALLKMEPRPAIDGLSIGYIAKSYEPRSRPEDPRRKLTKVDLLEVSLVTFPANAKARIGAVKSAVGLTVKDAEEALRDAGFSRMEAKAILAKGFKAIGQREAGDGDQVAALQRLISTISR